MSADGATPDGGASGTEELARLRGGITIRLFRGWPEEAPAAWSALWPANSLAPGLAEMGAHLRAAPANVWTLEIRLGERALGVVPLRRGTRRVRGVPLSVLSLAGADLYDYLPLAVAVDLPGSTFDAALRLAARRLEVDALALDNLLPPLPASLDRYARRFENRYFDSTGAADGWRTLTRKESLRRHGNRARRDLRYTVAHATGEIPEALLDDIARLHIERWRFDGVDSPFLRPERLVQYRACEGRTLVTVVRHGETIVAAHFGLRAGDDTLLWHTPTINIAYLPWSPFEVLLLETIEECARRELRILDYGLGDEAYKARFSNATRAVWNVFRPVTARGRLAAVLRRLPAARALRRRLGAGRARLKAAAAALARLGAPDRCFIAARREAPATAGETAPVLREARDFGEYVDLMRAAGIAVRRADYDRYRRGECFMALVGGSAMQAGGWRQRHGEAVTITDIHALPDRGVSLHSFLARLAAATPGARVVATGRDTALHDACRAAGFVETGCRRS